ncbi:MAG: DMP19 family protein [Bacteroides sp.]|nr:DMP19 family protein [Bacteroides sp.]
MSDQPLTTIAVKDAALRQAAGQGMDAFLQVFTDAYQAAMGGEPTAETMGRLTVEQHTLMAYTILRNEVCAGGFCQLIQNGYGPYIFHNPLAKLMRLWGLKELSKLLYDARTIYDARREELERERTDEEFMAMYEEFEELDELDETFIENEEEFTEAIARYVDEHIQEFACIVE